MLLVNQRGVCWMSVGNPLAGILDAVGVLRDGDDFEVLAFQLLIDCLPSWQVKAAPSPRGPCDKKHFLAAKVGQRMHLAVHVGQREVWRAE